jgi:hypothetical protein
MSEERKHTMDPYEWWLRCLSLTISEIQEEDKDAYDLLSKRMDSLGEEDAKLILKTVVARTAIRVGPQVEGAVRELEEQIHASFDRELGHEPPLH